MKLMTLLLALASPWGIYQSSDYRLTAVPAGTPEDDIAGSKQLTVSSIGLVAQVCFTGVAKVSGSRTRDWISEIIARTPQPLDIDRVVAEVVARGTEAIRALPLHLKMLTILVAIVKRDEKPRLVMISNIYRFDGLRRDQPLANLEVYSLRPSRPSVFVFGFDPAVSRSDRKFLESQLRVDCESKVILDSLASVNGHAARNPLSRGMISEGCMASSLLADGRSSAINYGEVEGIPDSFFGNINISEFVRTHFKAAPGKQITLRQSAGISGSTKGAPELLPEGEPRILHFSTPTSSMNGIANTFAGPFDKLIIGGLTGSVLIRKNEWTSAVINTVGFEAGQTTQDEKGFRLFSGLQITNLPTVEGAQAGSWDYTFDVLVERTVHTLNFRRMSMAFRSVNCKQPLPILGPTEELVMAAPKDPLTLSANPEHGVVTGVIEAQFLLRDFPELGPTITSDSITVRLPSGEEARLPIPIRTRTEIGRNEPCPCGSGKKYKKCHGRQ